jgi:DNA-binding NtrC family response regulator
MTTQAYSLPRVNDIPEPVESEVKRVAAPLPDESLEADWPTLAVLSRRYIDRALQYTRGNKTRAADLLGIDRRTLNRILVRDRVRRAKPRTE